MQDRLALDKRVDGVVDAGVRLEGEFARLELTALAVEIAIDLEQQRPLNDALAAQEIGDLARADVARDDDDLVLGQRPGLADLLLDRGDPQDQQEGEDDGKGQEAAQGRQKPASRSTDPGRRRGSGDGFYGFARTARSQTRHFHRVPGRGPRLDLVHETGFSAEHSGGPPHLALEGLVVR
jgi:hypothetical protein